VYLLSNRNRKIATHSLQPPTWCSVCKRTFTSIAYFRRHMEVFHKAIGTSDLVCPTCFLDCKTAYKLKAHFLKSHSAETKTFSCNACGVWYLTEVELQTHTVSNHKSGLIFTCHHCGEVYWQKKKILRHLITKHTDPVYEICSICGVQVVSASLMQTRNSLI
jgi:Zinc-finger of C2H2 type